MQSPYLPTQDGAFALWLDNFATLVAAAPATYGLVVGDATIITASNAAFQAAYVLAVTPETRTSSTIAAKDSQRASAEATIRPYAVAISRNFGVTDENKIDVGVNLPNTARTPIPAPTTAPVLAIVAASPGVHRLSYRDSSTPGTKAKPFGARAIELRRVAAMVPAIDPAQAGFADLLTKSPQNVAVAAADAGKIITYFGRWRTISGPGGVSQTGPWSAPLSTYGL